MDEIGKIEDEIRILLGVPGTQEIKTDLLNGWQLIAVSLLYQLKACREELNKYEYDHRDLMSIETEIEQRTKDVCIEAGWKWIKTMLKHRVPFPTDEAAFKQAIDKARYGND